jgi:hypothetical protein
MEEVNFRVAPQHRPRPVTLDNVGELAEGGHHFIRLKNRSIA